MIEEETTRRLPDAVCKSILKYSLGTDAKPYDIVLAALAVLLHKYTREEDMLVGSSSSNFNPLVLRMCRPHPHSPCFPSLPPSFSPFVPSMEHVFTLPRPWHSRAPEGKPRARYNTAQALRATRRGDQAQRCCVARALFPSEESILGIHA